MLIVARPVKADCTVAAEAFQAMVPVTAPLKASVNVPPVTPAAIVTVWTSLAPAAPAVISVIVPPPPVRSEPFPVIWLTAVFDGLLNVTT